MPAEMISYDPAGVFFPAGPHAEHGLAEGDVAAIAEKLQAARREVQLDAMAWGRWSGSAA